MTRTTLVGHDGSTTPEALAESSHRASLMVVGPRGRIAFTGMLLGSVSLEVLDCADCPVAVVR